ncbi:MAG: nickel-responsive transcriptional regulator NikR [Elusimicrobiota bacterium]
MDKLVRFGVSLNSGLLSEFDRHIKAKTYATRSKAIEDLIREALVKQEWEHGSGDAAGAITIVYDHHKRALVNDLLDIQHDYQDTIISTQHVHLTHDNCLEVIVVKGKPAEVQKLADELKSEKGVKHCSLTITSAG